MARYGVHQTHYRPRSFEGIRSLFVKQFLNDLERPYNGFLASQMADLVGQNEAVTGAPCYMIGDTVYARGPIIAKVGKYKLGGIAELQPHLQPLHDDFISHFNEHANNWLRFSQALQVILMRAGDWQELRDMLPDHVLAPYLTEEWGLGSLPRVRPDLGSVPVSVYNNVDGKVEYHSPPWDYALVKQYRAISETVDLYVGYRLL